MLFNIAATTFVIHSSFLVKYLPNVGILLEYGLMVHGKK